VTRHDCRPSLRPTSIPLRCGGSDVSTARAARNVSVRG
jgi:hypothetical protein